MRVKSTHRSARSPALLSAILFSSWCPPGRAAQPTLVTKFVTQFHRSLLLINYIIHSFIWKCNFASHGPLFFAFPKIERGIKRSLASLTILTTIFQKYSQTRMHISVSSLGLKIDALRRIDAYSGSVLRLLRIFVAETVEAQARKALSGLTDSGFRNSPPIWESCPAGCSNGVQLPALAFRHNVQSRRRCTAGASSGCME